MEQSSGSPLSEDPMQGSVKVVPNQDQQSASTSDGVSKMYDEKILEKVERIERHVEEILRKFEELEIELKYHHS